MIKDDRFYIRPTSETTIDQLADDITDWVMKMHAEVQEDIKMDKKKAQSERAKRLQSKIDGLTAEKQQSQSKKTPREMTDNAASKEKARSNKKFLKSIKKVLLAQKEELFAQENQEVVIDAQGDEIDQIQANILLSVDKQLGKRNAEKLRAIETALMRIQNKTYGLCLDCGEPISEKRLLINPVFQVCIGCAEERERVK